MSPYGLNPKADYVPPSMLTVAAASQSAASSSSYRRRGSTPIPPYEPPAERFTPPREIQLQAPATASPSKSKRRTHAKPSSKEKGAVRASTPVLPIKLELPEIDLTVPPPPPSPSDDPILLIGTSRPVPSTPKKRGYSSGPTTAHTPSSLFNEVDSDVDMDIPQPEFAPSSSSFFSDNIPPVFDFDNMDANGGGAWSDSDDGQADPGIVEGEGEFTGHFYQYRSPVKMHDPPSSATRVRIDHWGRPISPHPKLLIADGSLSADVIEEQDEVEDSPSAPKSRKVSPVHEYQEESSGWVDEEAEPVAGPSGSKLPMTLSEIEEIKFGETSIAQEDPEEREAPVENEGNDAHGVQDEEVHDQSVSQDNINGDVGMDDIQTTAEADNGLQEDSFRDQDKAEDIRPRSRSPQSDRHSEPPRPVNLLAEYAVKIDTNGILCNRLLRPLWILLENKVHS